MQGHQRVGALGGLERHNLRSAFGESHALPGIGQLAVADGHVVVALCRRDYLIDIKGDAVERGDGEGVGPRFIVDEYPCRVVALEMDLFDDIDVMVVDDRRRIVQTDVVVLRLKPYAA